MTTMLRNLFGYIWCSYWDWHTASTGTSWSIDRLFGQNPLVSIGGSAYHGETKVLFTAPADQDIIVKDVI